MSGIREPEPMEDRFEERPASDRRPRPEGDRRPRPEGDRRPRPEGGRRPRAGSRRRAKTSRPGWCAAYAAATFLAFPHPVGGTVLDLGPVLAWLAPVPLLLAVRGLRPGRAALWGFGAGLLAHAAVLHWIYVVTVTYGHAAPAVGVIAPVLLASYIALFTAAFAAGAAALRGRVAGPLALALLWTVLDHLRSFALTGFPWATLGYAQHGNPVLLGLAAWTGVYGLSFATALGAAGALAAAAPRRSGGIAGSRRAGMAALAGVVVLHGLGLLAAPEPVEGPAVRMAALQGDIDQGVKWSPAWAERTLAIYEDLTRQAAARGAQIVVWPETAVPGVPDASPELRAVLSRLARETGTSLVVGAVGADFPPAQRDEPHLFDSAFLVAPDGRLVDRYDKTHLVPFGEYLPFRTLLGRFVRAVATGSAGRDVARGVRPRAVRLPLPGGASEPGVTLGVPICYELLFPDLVRRFVADGAGVLLGITNDAWYGRTGAPYQFLAITALRSAETGVWTVRAANTGVSAVIDARGRVRERTDIFERGLIVADVPLRPPHQEPTFYARHGDAFAWACWLSFLGTAGIAFGRSRRSLEPEKSE